MRILFLLFLAVPIIEIYLLIEIGSQIGSVLTIFLILFTAVLGAFLVRAQGFATFAKVQMQLAKSESPAMEVMEGICLFLAGALLLTPGFFTDAVGFLCLTPPLRKLMISALVRRSMERNKNGFYDLRQGQGQRVNKAPKGRIIDAEFKDLD
ncbi:MAG: exlusion protein FxsA [Gammaproteobacteria bacterium]|nr:exlusion protein FxsA [Gammaproteobacteria bacterium]